MKLGTSAKSVYSYLLLFLEITLVVAILSVSRLFSYDIELNDKITDIRQSEHEIISRVEQVRSTLDGFYMLMLVFLENNDISAIEDFDGLKKKLSGLNDAVKYAAKEHARSGAVDGKVELCRLKQEEFISATRRILALNAIGRDGDLPATIAMERRAIAASAIPEEEAHAEARKTFFSSAYRDKIRRLHSSLLDVREGVCADVHAEVAHHVKRLQNAKIAIAVSSAFFVVNVFLLLFCYAKFVRFRDLGIGGYFLQSIASGNKSFIQEIMSLSHYPVLVKDVATGKYDWCNRAFLDYAHLCQSDIIGYGPEAVFGSETAAFFRGKDEELIAGGGKTIEFQFSSKRLRLGMYSMTCRKQIVASGKRSFIVTVIEDMPVLRRHFAGSIFKKDLFEYARRMSNMDEMIEFIAKHLLTAMDARYVIVKPLGAKPVLWNRSSLGQETATAEEEEMHKMDISDFDFDERIANLASASSGAAKYRRCDLFVRTVKGSDGDWGYFCVISPKQDVMLNKINETLVDSAASAISIVLSRKNNLSIIDSSGRENRILHDAILRHQKAADMWKRFIDSINIMAYVIDFSGEKKFRVTNALFDEAYGCKSTPAGMAIGDVMPKEEAELFAEKIAILDKTGGMNTFECTHRAKDDTVSRLHVRNVKLTLPSGEDVVCGCAMDVTLDYHQKNVTNAVNELFKLPIYAFAPGEYSQRVLDCLIRNCPTWHSVHYLPNGEGAKWVSACREEDGRVCPVDCSIDYLAAFFDGTEGKMYVRQFVDWREDERLKAVVSPKFGMYSGAILQSRDENSFYGIAVVFFNCRISLSRLEMGLHWYLMEAVFQLRSRYESRLKINDMIRLNDETLAKLKIERDRAVAAEETSRLFIASASHDIRTPLNSIVGFSELLMESGQLGDEAKSYAASIRNSSRTLLGLVGDILDFTKLAGGNAVFKREKCSFIEIAKEIFNEFSGEFSRKGLRFSVSHSPHPAAIYSDESRLRQIIYNLVGNAIKYTEKGGVAFRSSFTRKDGRTGMLFFEVEDTGRGIAPGDRERIFKPFSQVNPASDAAKGTGMGLAICDTIVKEMHGSITLESTPGAGSVFAVRLDNVEYEDSIVEAPLPRGASGGEAVVPANGVLVVDDISSNLAVFKAILKKVGIEDVVTALSAAAALKELERRPFSAVFTDIRMDGMSGEELAARIRERYGRMPVYAVTADVEAKIRCAGMGFSGILLKPVTIEDIKKIFTLQA